MTDSDPADYYSSLDDRSPEEVRLSRQVAALSQERSMLICALIKVLRERNEITLALTDLDIELLRQQKFFIEVQDHGRMLWFEVAPKASNEPGENRGGSRQKPSPKKNGNMMRHGN